LPGGTGSTLLKHPQTLLDTLAGIAFAFSGMLKDTLAVPQSIETFASVFSRLSTEIGLKWNLTLFGEAKEARASNNQVSFGF
tara:strand:+ start:171 stop:416 length:246 start_codon:yes stop_codon:yes gene_type:complete